MNLRRIDEEVVDSRRPPGARHGLLYADASRRELRARLLTDW